MSPVYWRSLAVFSMYYFAHTRALIRCGPVVFLLVVCLFLLSLKSSPRNMFHLLLVFIAQTILNDCTEFSMRPERDVFLQYLLFYCFTAKRSQTAPYSSGSFR